jgi:hypothetical protein
VAPIKGRDEVGDADAKVAKFKAGKALADTVKRNGTADDPQACEAGSECK